MEKELVDEYISILEPSWIIHKEVWGKSSLSGKPKRIDAIITNIEFNNLVFGIEFKRYDLGSFTNYSQWLKQIIIYTQCHWDGYGKIPILIAPSINYGNDQHKFILSHLIGEFGIGEISKTWYGTYSKYVYKILHKGTNIWNDHTGVNNVYKKSDFKKYLEL